MKDQFTSVDRNRISFTSTSSGWLVANTPAPRERLGRNRELRILLSAASGSVMLFGSSVDARMAMPRSGADR